MAESTLFDLPAEIHQLIIQSLDLPCLIRLKMTCRHFNALIPPLSVEQMMEVEVSAFGRQNDLYTCRDCMRLRPRTRFADNMVKKKRARSGVDAGKRFCVDCGINPRRGTTRYTRGSNIIIQGEQYVICRSCGSFRAAAVEGSRNAGECRSCRIFSRAIEQRAEEYRARQERARLRAEQAIRRARHREVWGSEYEYSDDDMTPSPSRSEIEMDMIQSEASMYMTSPKPGSE